MALFDNFDDTIFLKSNSILERKKDALEKLLLEYPNNSYLKAELFMVKRGLEGEKEIEYQLKKSNIGLYVIHDLNIEYEDLKAQIDYVVITKCFCYFLECKNLIGNITVDENGDFIREYSFNNKMIRKAIYSPLRQVEAQRDVYKKLWNTRLSKNAFINNIKRFLSEKNFEYFYQVLVVNTNYEGILNMKNAPSNVKEKVIKASELVNKIKYDLSKSDKVYWDSKKGMEEVANSFLRLNKEDTTDYYQYYLTKIKDNIINQGENINIASKLKELRRKRAKELGIPAFYVFTNVEMDKLLSLRPKSIEELEKSKILPLIKIKKHGQLIVEVFQKYSN